MTFLLTFIRDPNSIFDANLLSQSRNLSCKQTSNSIIISYGQIYPDETIMRRLNDRYKIYSVYQNHTERILIKTAVTCIQHSLAVA